MKKFEVVFDVDGVITNITDYICHKYNIDPKKIKKYSIKDCEELTADEARQILKSYGDYLLYREVEVEDGAERIVNIQLDYDCDVYLYSTCFNAGVAKAKYDFLIQNLYIPEENIEIVLDGDNGIKPARPNTDIIVEDSLENIIRYPAETFKILIDKTYNQSETYGSTDAENGIHRVSSLNEAIDLVEAELNNRGLSYGFSHNDSEV